MIDNEPTRAGPDLRAVPVAVLLRWKVKETLRGRRGAATGHRPALAVVT